MTDPDDLRRVEYYEDNFFYDELERDHDEMYIPEDDDYDEEQALQDAEDFENNEY